VDNIHRVILVLLSKMCEDSYLFMGLPMKPLLIPNYFYTNVALRFVIVSFYYLPKTAFANDLEYLISVGNMIMLYQNVTALIVVKTVVVTATRSHSLFSVRSYKIDVVVVCNFGTFERC
jgi:hypothetical protein